MALAGYRIWNFNLEADVSASVAWTGGSASAQEIVQGSSPFQTPLDTFFQRWCAGPNIILAFFVGSFGQVT